MSELLTEEGDINFLFKEKRELFMDDVISSSTKTFKDIYGQ